jgi:hypothetical protein
VIGKERLATELHQKLPEQHRTRSRGIGLFHGEGWDQIAEKKESADCPIWQESFIGVYDCFGLLYMLHALIAKVTQ